MEIISEPAQVKQHVMSVATKGLIFNPAAVEITILNRWGKTIWAKARGQSLEPICWDGLDLTGHHVDGGAFTCKIVYPDLFVVYVPIMFFQK